MDVITDETGAQVVVGQVTFPFDAVAKICRRYQVRELAMFGSALRDDFRPDSDVDLLVTFRAGHKNGLVEYISCQMELAELLGRPVDLVEKEGLKPLLRRQILETARVIYEE